MVPMSFLAQEADRICLQISNNDSLIADAPVTHFYGQKVGTDTYHHDRIHPSALRLHERPRWRHDAIVKHPRLVRAR
jgi:hypothetical protein